MSARGVVLSLFSGVGALDAAFREAGWCVVSAGDVAFSSLYDIRDFHPPPGVFDGVIGGPPCPAHSRLRHTIERNGYAPAEDLVGEMERIVAEAGPRWWVLENAPRCREPAVPGYRVCAQRIDHHQLGEDQGRLRLIAFGTPEGLSLEIPQAPNPRPRAHAVTADPRPVPVAIGGSGKRKPGADLPKRSLAECIALQGLPAELFEHSPLTMQGKRKLVGNAVPMAMGRAVARAVAAALEG